MREFIAKQFKKIGNSIKLKIILIYIMSLVIVYIATWWGLSIFLFQPLEKERVQNMIYNSEKIINNIRTERENYDNILYRLCNNRIIYKSLSDQCKNYEEVWTALMNIKYTLNEDMARSSIIKKLEVYQQGSDIGQDGRYIFADEFERTKFKASNWISETIDGRVLLCKYQKVFSLYNDVEAYIKIAIESQDAFGGVTDLEHGMSGKVYLTNEEDIVITSSEPNSIGNDLHNIFPDEFFDLLDGEIVEKNQTMIIKSPIDEKWNVWLLVSSYQFDLKVMHTKIVVGIVLLGYGFCSAIVLSLLLKQVFKRLHKLGEKMEQIRGNISYITIPEKCDEVTVLEIKYNSMLMTLENVIDEMAEVKNQKQKFELKSLESQINPHFLYNTLGVMRWEALECLNQKLVTMIDDLTTFYRLSLNKGQGLLNVEQELKLVKAYINIQQMRWDNVVEVNITMDCEVKEIMIPKMILQPLVENIWLHGNITAKENRKIKVSALNSDLYVEFRVWDNGDGISEDIIDKIQVSKNVEDSCGIGISFIRNILNHYYGNNYVYEVSSDRQLGTLVHIKLPKEMGVIH